MLERLSEIAFIKLLRHEILAAGPRSTGWLAALAEPGLRRCLDAIHADLARNWSLPGLAAAASLSRSALTGRFEAVLGTSPMRYVRDWRLVVASQALRATAPPDRAIAYDAGYGT